MSTATIPTLPPKRVNAGDSWAWDVVLSEYSPMDGWALAFHVRPGTVDIINTMVTATADRWQVRVPSSTTATIAAGKYRLVGYVSLDDDRVEVYNEILTIRPNFASPDATAVLSHDERMVEILTAALEGRLTADLQSYSINGRAVNKIPAKELHELLGYYRGRVRRQRKGKVTRAVEVRFDR